MIGYNKSEIVGKMRERVILQNRIITQSDSGFQSEIYNDIGIYWSKIEYKTGFEEEDADKITNQQKINITLRYNILVNVNSRFVYRNELYQVEKVEYSDDRRFMTCVCVWRSSYTSIYAGSIFCSASLLAQSSLSAALMRVIKYQSSLNAFSSVMADINFVHKVQASLLTSASVTGDITIPKFFNASFLATGTTTADLTVTAAASLLLDLYPSAAAAYSLRKLRSAYTGSAIRVRRSSDNTEQDIGFVADQLDTVSLLSFCGAGNGFVTTWYDQSGNARNATQTTQASQPQIVSSGSVILDNSKPSIEFTNDVLVTQNTNIFEFNNKFYITHVNSFTTYSNYQIPLSTTSDGNANTGWWLEYGTTRGFTMYSNKIERLQDNIVSLTSLSLNTSRLFTILQNSTGIEGRFNNTLFGSSTYNGLIGSTDRPLYISGNISSNFANIKIQEIIIYPSDQSSNRTGIESNINTHYAIY